MRKNSISLRSRPSARERLGENMRHLEYYYPLNRKSEIIGEKLRQKQVDKHNRNQQTLITDWLFRGQDRSNDKHLLLKIDKPVVLLIFQFLTLTDSARVSRACRYLHRCYNSIWLSLDYFEEFDLGHFSVMELKKVMEKSVRLTHIRTVKRLLNGKNLQHYTDKIRLKAVASQVTGQLVSFEIEPKRPNMGVFLVDENILEICGQSYQSLMLVSLINCHFLTGKSFVGISKCRKLRNFSLTRNNLVEDQHIEDIVNGCKLITNMNLSGCESLSEACFRSLAKLQDLKVLNMSWFKGSMGTLWLLGSLPLQQLNLSNSTVRNIELSSVLKFNNIESLNISGCEYISIDGLEILVTMEACRMKSLNISRSNLTEEDIYRLVEHTSLESISIPTLTPRILERLLANRSPRSIPSSKPNSY